MLLCPMFASATTTPVCAFAEQRLAEVQTEWSHAGFYRAKKPIAGQWRENLARRYQTEAQVFKAWEASPTHNENLMATSTEQCLRSANGYWVLIKWQTKATSTVHKVL